MLAVLKAIGAIEGYYPGMGRRWEGLKLFKHGKVKFSDTQKSWQESALLSGILPNSSKSVLSFQTATSNTSVGLRFVPVCLRSSVPSFLQ